MEFFCSLCGNTLDYDMGKNFFFAMKRGDFMMKSLFIQSPKKILSHPLNDINSHPNQSSLLTK